MFCLRDRQPLAFSHRLCERCDVCYRASFACRSEHFHTRFVATLLQLPDVELGDFLDAFYHMVVQEEDRYASLQPLPFQ